MAFPVKYGTNISEILKITQEFNRSEVFALELNIIIMKSSNQISGSAYFM